MAEFDLKAIKRKLLSPDKEEEERRTKLRMETRETERELEDILRDDDFDLRKGLRAMMKHQMISDRRIQLLCDNFERIQVWIEAIENEVLEVTNRLTDIEKDMNEKVLPVLESVDLANTNVKQETLQLLI